MAGVVDGDPDLQEEAGIMHHVLTQLLRYQVSVFTRKTTIFLYIVSDELCIELIKELSSIFESIFHALFKLNQTPDTLCHFRFESFLME